MRKSLIYLREWCCYDHQCIYNITNLLCRSRLYFLYSKGQSSLFFFFSSRRRHTRLQGDWSSDVFFRSYSGSFEFTPVFKLWIANNQRPRVTDDALGFWRRVRLLPFERQFSPKSEPSLKETLRGESSGKIGRASCRERV